MERKAADFKDELRSADLLLIDDVHFIGGKQSSEEELFHTLACADGGRPPRGVLRRPAAGGAHRDRRAAALAPLGRPGLRHRAGRPHAAARHPASASSTLLCRQQGVAAQLRPEVLQFLADRFTDSVRELEGALNTLIVRAGAGVGGLTLEETQAFLRPAPARRREAGHRRRHPEGDRRALRPEAGRPDLRAAHPRRWRGRGRRRCGWPSS